MIKHLSMFLMAIGLSFLISGCGGAKLTPEAQEVFDSKANMYTTKNMHFNISRGANIIETTNYHVGFLIPVNSQVTMEAINSRQIVFLYDGKKIILRNIPKYSGLNISAVLEEYFSAKKVNLSKFTQAEQKAIKTGTLVKGMSKDAVLVSLGTPPAHRTPDTTMDTWTYWKNRFTTFTVSFKDKKVLSNTPMH